MRRPLLLITWILTDALVFLGSFALAYFLRVGFIFSSDFRFDWYAQAVVGTLPLWLGVLVFLGVFRLTRTQVSKQNIAYIVFAAVLALAFFSLTYYFLFGKFFSRLLLIYAGGFLLLGSGIWHAVFDQFQRSVLTKGSPAFPVLIIGVNREAQRLVQLLKMQRSPLTPVAAIDSRGTGGKDVAGIPVVGKLNILEETIRKFHITHLLQCADLEHTLNLLGVAKEHKLTYMLLPSVLGIVGNEEEVDMLEGQPVTVVRF